MDLVQLKNGSTEIIGSHRDLVDIVEAGCGYEVAKKVDDLDPAAYDDVYSGYSKLFTLLWDYLRPLKEAEAGLTKEQTEKLYDELDDAVNMIGWCL